MVTKKIVQTTKDAELPIHGITLLSIEEYREFKDRIRLVENCWWLRSPGDHNLLAAVVDGDGIVHYFGNYVNVDYGVRPALRINLESSDLQIEDSFQFGGYTWTVISDDYALCDETIGRMAFRKEYDAPDANDYEKSDIKKHLEEWLFRNAGIRAS